MNLFKTLFNSIRQGSGRFNAATANVLESASKATINVQSGQRGQAVYMTSANKGGDPLDRTDMGLANTDVLDYRDDSTQELIRKATIASPAISASVDAYVRTAITQSFTAIARNIDGSFNTEATVAFQNVILRMDVLKDYEEGFNNMSSLRVVSEALAIELRRYGSCALELVLDEARLPYKLQPISVTQVKFKVADDGLSPIQDHEDGEIDLDIPTFFYMPLDQDLTEVYTNSPYESSIQALMFFQEFINDLRRIVRRAVHSRIKVELKAEDIYKNMPPKVKASTEETQKYLNEQIQAVADVINGLDPEDALVYLDNAHVEYMTAGNNSHSQELNELKAIIDSLMATGSKTPPTILGQSSKSSNIASTETMLFMKNVEGAVQIKLNELYSQVFTLALRLMGYEVVAEFKYKPIDLRPETELEAFKQMRQSRNLELLSLGLITDEEASLELTGRLPHAGAPVLSGTGFYGSISATAVDNPYSNTSQSTLNKNTESDQPKGAKGENGGE